MSGSNRPMILALAVVLALPALYGFGLPVDLGTTTSTAAWEDVDKATIRPGVQLVTAGSQCTSNFIFTRGDDVLIGMAAHCAGLGGGADTNGCTTSSRPLGTPVSIGGASRAGELVYSSWLAMQDANTTGSACWYNDFALVKIDPADHGRVNPTMRNWGGPTAVGGDTVAGEQVYSWGDSSLRLRLTALSPKPGLSLGMVGGGWSHLVYTATPGIPGDSGSGLIDSRGNAVGVLSTLTVAPLALSNNFSDLESSLTFARAHGMSGVALAVGTEPFDGSLLGLLG